MRPRRLFLLLGAPGILLACGGSDPSQTGGGGQTSTSTSGTTGTGAHGGTGGTGGGGSTGSTSSSSTTSSSSSTSSTSSTSCTGVCVPGATEQQACVWGPAVARTCAADCAWGPFPACDTPLGWRDMAPSSSAQVPAACAIAVWTGSAMLIWGGGAGSSASTYDPATNLWKKGAASPGGGQPVWTGSQLVTLSSGGGPPYAYDPATDTWTTLPGNMPLAGRVAFAFVAYLPATDEVMGWGGYSNPNEYADGAAYSLTKKTWRTVATGPLSPIDDYRPPGAVWAGGRLVVYGGGNLHGGRYNAAASYDPVTDTWASLPSPPQSGYTKLATLALGASGGVGLFWGGERHGGTYYNYPANDGALWDGTQWAYVPGVPGGGAYNAHVNGASFAAVGSFGLFGGLHFSNGFSDDGEGAVFDLATGAWTALPPGGPSPRQGAHAVWTGSEAIVWGGGGLDDGKIWRPCGATSLPCQTGKPGACAVGHYDCAGGSLTCVAPLPTAETCNDLDDDCNGVVDDPPPGPACNTGLDGVCAAGTMGCVHGAVGCVQTQQPGTEECNGLDDDCNGQVDEVNLAGNSCDTGLAGVCAPGYQQCQGGSVACLPLYENVVGLTCSTGKLGVCDFGFAQCQNGVPTCTQASFPGTEVCGNGLDDDCDGVIDNGCP